MPAPVVFRHAIYFFLANLEMKTKEIHVTARVKKHWSTYFANAALIPPCAATVCDLVGNSFVTHAVFNPASVKPTAARSPAPPAPTTIALHFGQQFNRPLTTESNLVPAIDILIVVINNREPTSEL